MVQQKSPKINILPLQGVSKLGHSDHAVANARALPFVDSCEFCQYKFTYNPVYTLDFSDFTGLGTRYLVLKACQISFWLKSAMSIDTHVDSVGNVY